MVNVDSLAQGLNVHVYVYSDGDLWDAEVVCS